MASGSTKHNTKQTEPRRKNTSLPWSARFSHGMQVYPSVVEQCCLKALSFECLLIDLQADFKFFSYFLRRTQITYLYESVPFFRTKIKYALLMVLEEVSKVYIVSD